MTLALLLILISGCTQDNGIKRHTNNPNGAYQFPTIIVEPSTLDFGEQGEGDVGSATFTISNQGTEMSVLTVDEIALTIGEDGGFAVVDRPELPLTLDWQQSAEVVVTFTPRTPAPVTGQVVVGSDDEENPAVPVALAGDGILPLLVLDPPEYDFGELTVGCETQATVMLSNAGDDDLDVASVVSEGAGYAIVERPDVPAVLAPGEAVPVTVAFAPSGGTAFGGGIAVESNDPRGTQRAIFTGSGALPGTHEDRYVLPTGGKVDLLIFVDQSVSMQDDQATLAANAQAFGTGLATLTDDWHLMVVTADNGCNTGGIITSATPNYGDVIGSAVLEGEEGWHSERGLYVSMLAVQAADAHECNEGFLREDALLHIVYISDEEEQSPEPWSTYVNQFRAIKGAEHLLKMSAVAGDIPSGCDSPTNSAGPGQGYWEATQETHGGFVSLCSDWSAQISTLSGYGVTRDTFALTGWPDESTIGVLVNGVRRGTGWHYMSDSNSIVFDEAIPVSGDSVDIAYVVPLACM